MPADREQKNHLVQTADTSPELVKRQRRFDAGETYKAVCSQARCRKRPEYDYSFEIYNAERRDWHIRHYSYCPEHMAITAHSKGLSVPACLPVEHYASTSDRRSGAIECIFCRTPKGHISTTRNGLVFVSCGSCGAQGPKMVTAEDALEAWKDAVTRQ